jgi:hypothetical protein
VSNERSDNTDTTELPDADDIPPMSFDIFVLSLNASALIHLGQAPQGVGGGQVNLPMARQSIDILGLIEQKTRGNLSGEEERLLHDILFDLRMRYSQAQSAR